MLYNITDRVIEKAGEKMAFEKFLGNQSVKEQLMTFINEGRFPHAILLEGPEGCGKKTLAREIARAAVCEGSLLSDEKPCGGCSHCIKAMAGSHPDIQEVTDPKDTKSYRVDAIRDMREQAFLAPNEADKRVMLLFDAQNLNASSQNALLRILEDPPAHLLFILTCENRSQLLSTIQSRVITFALSGVSEEEAVPYLMDCFPNADKAELSSALTMFDGCIGKVMETMEGGELSKVRELIVMGADALTKPERYSLLKWSAELEKEKESIDGVLNGLRLVLRDSLCILENHSGNLSTAPQQAETLARIYTGKQLIRAIEALESIQVARNRNMNMTLMLTSLCSRLNRAVGR